MYDAEAARSHRYNVGDDFEEELRSRLSALGLVVLPFGVQNIFPNGVLRGVAQQTVPAFRYLPDFLVTNRGGKGILAIEAKGHAVPIGRHHHACAADTFNELARFAAWAQHVPVLLVFSDWQCITLPAMQRLARIRSDTELMSKSRANGASGAPFYDVDCRDCLPLFDTLRSIFQ